jgi:hypothetical protein
MLVIVMLVMMTTTFIATITQEKKSNDSFYLFRLSPALFDALRPLTSHGVLHSLDGLLPARLLQLLRLAPRVAFARLDELQLLRVAPRQHRPVVLALHLQQLPRLVLTLSLQSLALVQHLKLRLPRCLGLPAPALVL